MSGFGLELTERQRTLLVALYPILLLLTLHPILEALTNSWPLVLDDPRIRVGLLGPMLNGMILVLTGLALITLVAALLGHGTVIRLVAIAAFLCAAVLAVGGLSFALDALQVRRMVRTDAKPHFDAASFKTLLVTGPMVLISAWLGLRAWAASKGAIGGAGERKAGLVVGQ